MQDIEKDMDGLFQRAADNYHLKEPNWDWNSIEQRINVSDDKVNIVPLFKEKKKYKWLLLILFFIIAVSAIFKIQIKTSVAHSAAIVKNNETANKNIRNNIRVISNIQTGQKYFLAKEFNNAKSSMKRQSTFHLSIAPGINDESENTNEIKNSQFFNKSINVLPDTAVPEQTTVKAIMSLAEKDQRKKDSTLLNSSGQQKNAATGHKAAFYLGLLGGPDFSNVKSGAVQPEGFGLGIIAGLPLSKKIFIETGAFFYHKSYSSEGKYFNMDKMGNSMPAGMTISNLESKVCLIEIPLKVKYNFSRTGHSDFFASAGLSAYVITNEKNNYNVSVNGNPGKMTGEYRSNNSTFPAVADFSLGYQHNLSGKIDIRVEPFLKIPLQGIGMGSVPVTSAGLHIGVIGHLK